MRLLMTTDTVGGVWTFTKELAVELIERGCEIVMVAFGRAPSHEQQAFADNLASAGRFRFIASEAPLEWMPANAIAYTAAKPLLLELCSSFQPDALLLSQFCFGALPVDVAKIVIAHSDVLSWAAATGKHPLPPDTWLRNYRTLVQSGLYGADAVVTPTLAMIHHLQRHFDVSCETVVIPNGRTIPQVNKPAERELRAITAGRMWDPAKNLHLLNTVNSPVPILVAGEKDPTKTSGHNIHLLGHQSEANLFHLFRNSAIYLCTSVYEPFGLAPLEAALCGCAVLANDIPSLREVWGDAALYFHDASSLTSLLCTLREDSLALAKAQAKSQARARTYTAARMTDTYLELIQTSSQHTGRLQAHAA